MLSALVFIVLLVPEVIASSAQSQSQGRPVSGPARAGLFIYAKDLERLASFYQSILGMGRVHSAPNLVVLRSSDIQITVNAMPLEVAAAVEITAPPVRRDTAAFKFFFTVPSISEALEIARSLGGDFLPEQWQGRGFVVRNAVDPEGNIFQIRESAP